MRTPTSGRDCGRAAGAPPPARTSENARRPGASGDGERQDCADGARPQRWSADKWQGLAPPALPGRSTSLRRTAGISPEPQRLATGRREPPGPPEGGGLSPRSRSTEQAPDVSVQAPGSLAGAWPLAARGRPWRLWRPSLPKEHPAGRNFGKEGATPSTRYCPREPFARDPVQRGVSAGRLRPLQGWGDKFCATEA